MADLHQPDLAITEVLDEFGVDGLIARAYAGPKRIAMLRIHHATENAQAAVDWVADVIAIAIGNPALYRAEIVENARTLAAKLRVLADELEKSVPVVSLREGEELAQTRGLRREDQETAAEKRDGRRDPPTDPPAIGETSPSDDPEAVAPAEPWALSPAEVVGRMALLGDPIPTGCPFIDRETRHGGIPPGKLILVGGPPQSGKSHLFAQFMLEMSRHGKSYALMADAGWEDTSVSLGSIAGVPRGEIRRAPAAAAPAVAEALLERPILMVNPDHPNATLRDFLAYVETDIAPGDTPIVFVDSAQAIRHGLDPDAQGKNSDAQVVGQMCRSFATRRRAIVFLSSKANRAFYRNRKKDENATAISAFMGGDYEYTADMAIVLSRPDKDTGFIGLEFAKNRLGRPGPPDITLRYDLNSNRLLEVDDAEIDAMEMGKNVETLRPVKEKIKSAVKGKKEISKNAIYELVRGKRQHVWDAIDLMVKDGSLDAFPSPSGRSITYRYVDRA